MRYLLACLAAFTLSVDLGRGQSPAKSEQGIPVTDSLVIAKCGACHPRDERGVMQHISWVRTTPEGWQDVFKRMVMGNGLTLTTPEARAILRYLSASHGLSPAEAKPIAYDAERRIHEETLAPNEKVADACTKCHTMARALSWRRSSEKWEQFAAAHAERYKVPTEEALAFLLKAAPLQTPEWNTWVSREQPASLSGRWLVTASMPGLGKYVGEMHVDPTGNDEFTTRVTLTSVADGSKVVRSGRSAVYGSHAWRGRSKGMTSATGPADPSSEAREVLWFAPGQSIAEGRWFWGQYQEFGFDVKLQRATSSPALLTLDRSALKTDSKANRIRIIGDNLPGTVTPGDLNFGPGVSVSAIVSQTPAEILAELDVAADAKLGKRDVALRNSVLPGVIAIYDRVDYLKAMPESSVASFADRGRLAGYQQFEAIGFQRGADGKLHTPDDVDLGPVDVTWSIEVFYAPEGSNTDFVGKLSSTGLFTPAPVSPNSNVDIWVVATARNEKNKRDKPLVGKSYVVVTLPSYTFNGRRYVRDLNRWLDDGPASSQ